MNRRSLRPILLLFAFFPILIMMTPVQAINTTLMPTSATAGSTSTAYTAKLDPTGGPAGGFYYLNMTIPAGYGLNLRAAGQTVVNYTMFDIAQNKNKVLINITSATSDPDGYLVNVTFSTDYGATFSTINNKNISNMSIGASALTMTKPTATAPGYLNLSLGTAGPINSTNNNVTLELASGAITNPSTPGNYNWTIEAKNNSTDTAYTSYNIVQQTTVATTSSNSGGGGGGGGGGGTSGENFTNIDLKEKFDLYIFKDKATRYEFRNNSNPIVFINITGNVSAGEVNIAVEVLKNTSTLVKSPAPGIVYKNINIWVGTSKFAVPKNIKTSVIRFRVMNSWIDNNGLDTSDIIMVKWNVSEWIQLETAEISRDSNYTYYDAKTNYFSPFAITAFKKEAMPTVVATPTPLVIKEMPTPAAVQKENEKGITDILIITAVILAIITTILAAVYIKKQREKNKNLLLN